MKNTLKEINDKLNSTTEKTSELDDIAIEIRKWSIEIKVREWKK